MNNSTRKDELKKEIFSYNFQNSYLIIKLINNNKIDNLIEKITDTKTKVNITTITKKKYLSGNEQFLILLNNFIYQFKEDFYFLNNGSDYIIETLLQNEKYSKYLLCKKYIGNNEYIKYFSNNKKKLVTWGFYNNLKILSKESELIRKFSKTNNINTKRNFFNNRGIEILYNTLIKISICNAKTQNNILLFEDINNYNNQKNTSLIYKFYITEWEIMIKNYYEKIDAINTLLK